MTIVLATCRHRPSLSASDELLAAHLRARGARVAAAPWDVLNPDRLGDATVCLRSTWDYHTRANEFRAWLAALGEHRLAVVNPVATVRWNMDKHYLASLEARGIAIPETRWIGSGDAIDLPALLADTGWERAVVKPRISATAHGTHLVGPGTVLDHDQLRALGETGALLQAFVPEIQSAGEVSLMFIDGEFSHAIRKRPVAGDFRVQHEYGGTVERDDTSMTLRAFGLRVLDAIPVPWTYARVDLVDTRRGPVLMELELIEPDLFFTFFPDGAARLGDALLRGRCHD